MKRSINLVAEFSVAVEPPPSLGRVLSVIGAALIIPVVVWGMHARAASRLDPKVAELRATRDRLVQDGDQVRHVVVDLQAQIAQRVAERARAEQINWSEAFRELSLVVPRGMWLSELGRPDAVASAPDGGTGDLALRIRGLATSQRVVSELLQNLETSERFGDPLVIYTQRGTNPGIARVEFEVQCALRRGPISGARAGNTA